MEISEMCIGDKCLKFREYTLKITRLEFSKETGLSVSQIRHFEQGRSRNMMILIEYMRRGLSILDLVKDIDTARILSNADNKSSEPRVIIPTDSIEVLRLSNIAYNILMRAGIETVDELRKKVEDADGLSKLRGMGVSTLAEITNKLKELDKQGIEQIQVH